MKKATEDMFKTHQMDSEQIKESNALRQSFINLASLMDSMLVDSREKSLALTKLEQSLFYTTACIARNK